MSSHLSSGLVIAGVTVLMSVFTILGAILYFSVLRAVRSDLIKIVACLVFVGAGIALPLYLFSVIFVSYKVNEDFRMLAFLVWIVPYLSYLILRRRARSR